MLKYLIYYKDKFKKQDIASFGQKYLSEGITQIALLLSEETGIKLFTLSGGVFINEFVTSYITNKLSNSKCRVFRNIKVPSGDGGIALGQAIIGLNNVI